MWSFIFSVKYCAVIIYSLPQKFISVIRGVFLLFILQLLAELPGRNKKTKSLDCL